MCKRNTSLEASSAVQEKHLTKTSMGCVRETPHWNWLEVCKRSTSLEVASEVQEKHLTKTSMKCVREKPHQN